MPTTLQLIELICSVQSASSFAHQVIAWIVYSHRPLSPIELQTALAIKPGHFKDPKRNLPGIKIVLAVCAGLVVVDEETRVVRLVHYTTQEYFSKGKLRGWLPGIEVEIARSCITYILIPDLYESVLQYHEQWSREQYLGRPSSYRNDYDNPYYRLPSGSTFEPWEFWSDVQKWPFFVYAIKYWGNHCQPFQEALEVMIVNFFSNPRTRALYWTHRTAWGVHFDSRPRTATYCLTQFQVEKPGPISVASRLGLDMYLEKLLVQGHTYEASAWFSASVRESWSRRCLSPAHYLIEQHPLVLASYWGHYRAATILLEHTYTQEKDLYRALRTACSKRNAEIVELLISRWPSKYIDLMEIAEFDIIDSGKPKELLLSRNLQNSFKSLSILAGRRGASSWIQFLLQRDWDTDVDEMGNERRVVLETAASEGCLENLQLLLANPKFDLSLEIFDFDGPRNLFGYTIVEAAHLGQHETVGFLLKNRPQLKSRTMEAILIKAFKRARASVSMVKSFDERFREVRYDEPSRDNLCRCLNLLRQASSWPGKNIGIQHHRGLVTDVNEKIRRLLHKNARMDPKEWPWDDQTPLSYAAAAEDNSVAVKLLLQHPGVDADSRDSCGWTPLSRAATVKGNSATVRLLLDHPGVNPDSFDSFHLTPLSWAIFGGCVESVRALLGRTRISRKEYKRAAAVRLAQLWLGWKRELGSTKRLNVNSATQDERDHVVLSTADYRAVVVLLMSEMEQLYLKEYSAAVSNGALILALLEESNENTSRGEMSG